MELLFLIKDDGQAVYISTVRVETGVDSAPQPKAWGTTTGRTQTRQEEIEKRRGKKLEAY